VCVCVCLLSLLILIVVFLSFSSLFINVFSMQWIISVILDVIPWSVEFGPDASRVS
jgi:hypothetical protein